MSGGNGADRFEFSQFDVGNVGAGNRDVVADFSHAQGDRLLVGGIDAITFTPGYEAFSFRGTAGFNAPGQLRYEIGGELEKIDVHTVITWQGRWFVTHLRKFKK